MKVLRTSSRGNGICIGRAFTVRPGKASELVTLHHSFTDALELAKTELEVLAKDSDIFAAHLEMIQDPMIEGTFLEMKDDAIDDAEACREAREVICEMFSTIDDEYLRARVDDIRDVFDRILGHIEGSTRAIQFAGIPEGAIVVAENLTPSDTTLMDIDSVGGFITAGGSSTSHVCIIASAHGKPAVVGVTNCMEKIHDGDLLVVDAYEGLVLVNPGEAQLADFRIKEEAQKAKMNCILASGPITASDGRSIRIYGNAGNIKEIRSAMEAGADGIGLFRTEFLYMQSKDAFPSEDVQFEAYREAAQLCQGKVLTIRTLDIGGDKKLPYWEAPAEENPFLGFRAIRVSMAMPDMFREQLRAILRASAFGRIRLMFPMITSVRELDRAIGYLEECKAELSGKGIGFDPDMEIGIMVETPAAVFVADELAEKLSFFSLGTNDLTQYVLAADRGNAAIAHIYNETSPAVLRAIRMTIEAAHRHGIECCMCGELAGNPRITGELLESGLDSFSVSAPSVNLIKSTCLSIIGQ